MVSVADIKPFHERPVELRHAFEDEFAHLAWGLDIGLAEVSTAAAPLYRHVGLGVHGQAPGWRRV